MHPRQSNRDQTLVIGLFDVRPKLGLGCGYSTFRRSTLVDMGGRTPFPDLLQQLDLPPFVAKLFQIKVVVYFVAEDTGEVVENFWGDPSHPTVTLKYSQPNFDSLGEYSCLAPRDQP